MARAFRILSAICLASTTAAGCSGARIMPPDGGAGGPGVGGGIASGGTTGNGGAAGNAGAGGAAGTGGGGGSPSTVYVSPQGKDTWSGTLAESSNDQTDGPFATFERARQYVQALDKTGLNEVHVQFRDGTYYLSAPQVLTSDDSGTPSTRIFYEAYPGESPVISGGMIVTGWSHAGNRWTAQLPPQTVDFESLYYAGERRLRPRLGGYLGTYLRIKNPVYLTECEGQGDYDQTQGGYLCMDRFDAEPGDLVGADDWGNLTAAAGNPCNQTTSSQAPVGDVQLVNFEQFNISRLRIECVDTAAGRVYVTGAIPFDAPHPNSHGYLADHRYLIENVQSAQTVAGQWFLDRAVPGQFVLTYLANSGEDPSQGTIVIPQAGQVLVASGLQYVTFKGLTFSHDNQVIDETIGYPADTNPRAAVSLQNTQDVTLDSCTISHTSGSGVEIVSCINANAPPNRCLQYSATSVSADNTLQNSALYDIGADGVIVGVGARKADTTDNIPYSNIVQNTVISGYGRAYPGAIGILQGNGHDNLYTHNEIFDGYHGAIHLHNGSDTNGVLPDNNTISFNHVHDLFQGISNDTGALYVGVGALTGPNGPASGAGNKILNNVVHDISDASVMDADGYGGDGLYVDDFAGDVDLENNLVYRVSGDAIAFSGPRPTMVHQDSIVKNNILAYARTAIIGAYDPYKFLTTTTQPPLFFVATSNIMYFDRDQNSTALPAYPQTGTTPLPSPFYVQGSMTFSDSSDYDTFEQWVSDIYYRVSATNPFDTDPIAFHIQPSYAAKKANWTDYTFAQWLSEANEDAGAAVMDPGFVAPGYAAGDDYSFANKTGPGHGFVPFKPGDAGRTSTALKPPKVPATFPTATFDRTADF